MSVLLGVILCLEVWESHTLYVYIFIFRVDASREFYSVSLCWLCGWLNYWFWWHVNLYKVISCLKVTESHSLNIYIYFILSCLLRILWNTFIWYQVFQSNTNYLNIPVLFQVFVSNNINSYTIIWRWVIIFI